MSGCHSIQLLEQLNFLRHKKLFCDVIIRVMAGQTFIAHRCVLAASSPKLHSLVSLVSSHGRLKSVVLLESLTVSGFEPVLEYIYTGKLKLDMDNISEVLATACYLELPDVIELCERMSSDTSALDKCTSQGISQFEALWEIKPDTLNPLLIPCSIGLSSKETATVPEEKMTHGLSAAEMMTSDVPVECHHDTGSESLSNDETECNYDVSVDSPFGVVSDDGSRPNDYDQDLHVNATVDENKWRETVEVLLSSELAGQEPYNITSSRNSTKNQHRARKPTAKRRRKKRAVPKESFGCVENQGEDERLSENVLLETSATKGEAMKLEKEIGSSDESFLTCLSFAGELARTSTESTDVQQAARAPKKHILARKRIEIGPVACKVCGKLCARLSALTRHARSHSTQTFPCAHCTSTFSNPIDYKRHAVTAHGARRVFTCSFPGCKFGSDRLSTVERHAVIHSEVHVHSCNRCGKTFAQENGLLSHLRSCLEMRSYLCDLCGAAFNHLQSMHSHRRVHTGEKPYECDACGSHFADYRNLKRHQRIHENAFPYVCVVCAKKFRHSNSLKTHLGCHQVVQQDVKCV